MLKAEKILFISLIKKNTLHSKGTIFRDIIYTLF